MSVFVLVSHRLDSDALTGVCTAGGANDDSGLVAFVVAPDAAALAVAAVAAAAWAVAAAMGKIQERPKTRRGGETAASNLKRSMLVIVVFMLQVQCFKL